ncbi:TIGR01841 family phasin [Paraburkholderia silviterrae]|uniref:TIGR01841 family phasin n=1 Tax=Paraburkholderia silviterrae TaxID=2528715 RepID=UPI001F0E4029|nr:TIGR01841 family phasin [Paraburkholderia silviterrae]
MTEPVTFFAPDRLRAHYESGVAVFFALAKPAFENFEATIALNMQTARATIAESEAALKSTLQISNPVELFTQQLNASQQAASKAMAYGRKLFDIAAHTHSEWVEVAQAQTVRQEQCVKALAERFSQSAPAGSEPFVAAMNSTFAAFGNAADSMRTMTRQAIEAAQGRLDTVAAATQRAAQTRQAAN